MKKKPPRKWNGPKRTDADRRADKKSVRAPAQLAAEFERRKRAQLARAAIELDHVDAEILRMLLQHPTITHRQIADILGCRRQTVTVHINAPKFKRALESANRSALEIFESNKAKAARKLGQLID